jgi:hypothetical protein
MGESWFSASFRFATHVGAEERTHDDSVIVFHAIDWTALPERAIDLGRGMGQRHENVDRVPVERRLVDVRTLVEFGGEVTEGREVCCPGRVVGERS